MLYQLDDSWIDPDNIEFIAPNISQVLKCDHIFMTIKQVKTVKFSDFFGAPYWDRIIDFDLYIELRKTYCILCKLQNTKFFYVN